MPVSLPPTSNSVTPSEANETALPTQPMVVLRCFELSRYRRLLNVRCDLQPDTTILVGSNNSGKSSLIQAIHKFLSHATLGKGRSESFTAYDLSSDSWQKLIELGLKWEQEQEFNHSNSTEEQRQELQDERQKQLTLIRSLMPTLDVWFEAQDGAWHLVRDLIPTLCWSGGQLGLRLQIEPVSDLEGLDYLIEDYRKQRMRLKSPNSSDSDTKLNSPRVWPRDLLDYFKRKPSILNSIVAYRLDPEKLNELDPNGHSKPQQLPSSSIALSDRPLRHLMKVDFIPAQRGLGKEEAGSSLNSIGTKGMLSQQLVRYAKAMLDKGKDDSEIQESQDFLPVKQALLDAHTSLDKALNEAMKQPIDEVRELGHLGLGQALNIELRTDVNVPDSLRHSSAVQYRSSIASNDAQHLPEHAIGLGYQNLLHLSFSLMRFRDERLLLPKQAKEGDPSYPPILHLVLLEEPEAHLHVQVQRTFIKRAHARIKPSKRPELSTQLLVSTHSSHMAHAADFANLRYLRRLPRNPSKPLPTSTIISLAGTFDELTKDKEGTKKFVQRYLRIQHNDLLFADGLILVEGTAEKVLIPAFIERDYKDTLQRRYISILEVGGSHAHRLKPLLEQLRIPTLLIADIDSAKVPHSTNSTKKVNSRLKKCAVKSGDNQCSLNPSIKAFLKEKDIDVLLKLEDSKKILALGNDENTNLRIAYQIPADDLASCGSSFEDALILENVEWFKALPGSVEHPMSLIKTCINGDLANAALALKLHEEISCKSFDKGAFSLDLFTRLVDRHENHELKCPRYITEGLNWLSEQLNDLEVKLDGGQP